MDSHSQRQCHDLPPDDPDDVTGRNRIEEALRESEEKYSALFAASPAPFLILKPDAPNFTIAEVNDAYLAATMRTRDDLVGRGVFEAFPDNPFDNTVSGASKLRASLERVLATDQPDRLPDLRYDIARPDGTFEQRWWSPINSAVLDVNGEVVAIVHNANDVTEQYRAETELRYRSEQLNTLIDQAPIGVYLVDGDFRIVQVNAVAQPVFGRIPDLIGRDFDEVIHILWEKQYADEVSHLFRHTLETGEPYETPERAEFRTDRGSRRILLVAD